MALRFWRAEESVTARGNLTDVRVVELVRLIGQARKTGALAMSSGDNESVLYFRKGTLIDASAGKDQGLDALSQIVDWSDGTFEFRNGAESDDVTIDMDVHAALIAAAGINNEKTARAQEEAWRKQDEEKRLAAESKPVHVAEEQPEPMVEKQPEPAVEEKPVLGAEQASEYGVFLSAEPEQQISETKATAESTIIVPEIDSRPTDAYSYSYAFEAQPERVAEPQPEPVTEEKAEVRLEQSTYSSYSAAEEQTPQPLDAETCERISQWIAKSPFLRHVSLLDAEGRVIGEAHALGASPNGTARLSQHMREFVREYPRAEMRRVVIEDEAGTVVMASLPQERLLIAVADGSVSLGSVCVTLNKMTISLGA